MKIAAWAFGASLAAIALAAPVQAQQFTRAIVFGDSLSDNGNIAAANGGFVPNYLPIRVTRFSNGPVWSEQLFGPAGTFLGSATQPNVGNIDYAFGGSRTSGAQTPGPTTAEQIGIYLQRGGRFGAGDVATLWAGANNIFQGIPVAAANPATAQATMTAVATGAASDIGAQVRQLAAAGARTIIVPNLPGFGTLPQFAGTAASQLAEFSTATFNGALAGNLAAAAAANPGTNVISVDVVSLFAAVQANPASFGFANASQACVLTPSCAANPAAWNSFAFWDGVHPTQAGHALVAATVLEHLQAPARGAVVSTAFGETAFALRRSAAINAMAELEVAGPAPVARAAVISKGGPAPAPVAISPWRYFISVTGDYGQSNATFANGVLAAAGVSEGRGYEYKSGGIRFGGVRDIGSGWSVGGAFYAQTGTIDGGRARFSSDATQIGGDVIARWSTGRGSFVNMALGFNLDQFSKYEYRTVGPLQNTGSTSGLSASALVETGYDFRMGALTLTPVGRIGYIHSRVDGFTEAGIVAPIAYGARTTEGLVGAVELRAAYRLTEAAKVGVMIGYEDFLASSAKGTGRIAGNTAQPFALSTRDPIGQGVIFGANAEASFGAWTAKLSYKGAVGEDKTVRHGGTIGASFRF
jgi:outer membrane lipase/esterase